MDKDRSAMEHMLEEQRHRQAEAMRARLAERRIKRKKNQKARHATEQSEEQAIADQQKRLDELHRRQQQEHDELHNQLNNEEKAEAENYMAKDADEEFQIGKIGDLEELERLKDQLNASLESHSESMDENRRIEHERLLRKLHLKQIQLEKKKEAQVQLADAKGRGDDAAVQRIQEKYKADINNLKASADAEKHRQQEALANRLKRRREAKERELRRRHERETNELQMQNMEQAKELQESLEEDDQLKKNINEAKKDAENAVDLANSRDEALALLDEQAKMREAIKSGMMKKKQS